MINKIKWFLKDYSVSMQFKVINMDEWMGKH